MCPRRAGASVRRARVRTTNSPEHHREEVTVKVETADRTARRRIATTDSYAEAEAVVDRLADDGFPVEHVSIVGRDLEYVEQVIGQRFDVLVDEAFADEAVRWLGAGGIHTP
jgi:hypothetical protein